MGGGRNGVLRGRTLAASNSVALAKKLFVVPLGTQVVPAADAGRVPSRAIRGGAC